MLETAEFAPGVVEFTCHADEIIIFERADICGGERKMVVAPAARGQALKLKMSVAVYQRIAALGDVTRVVEYRCGVAVFPDRCVRCGGVFLKGHH